MSKLDVNRLKEPAAWIMLSAGGLTILFAVLDILIGSSSAFSGGLTGRISGQLFTVTSPVTTALLLGAYVLVTRVGDPSPKAKLFAFGAAGGLAVAAVIGVLGLIMGLFSGDALDKVEFVLRGGAFLALTGIALVYLLPQVIPDRPAVPAPGFGYPQQQQYGQPYGQQGFEQQQYGQQPPSGQQYGQPPQFAQQPQYGQQPPSGQQFDPQFGGQAPPPQEQPQQFQEQAYQEPPTAHVRPALPPAGQDQSYAPPQPEQAAYTPEPSYEPAPAPAYNPEPAYTPEPSYAPQPESQQQYLPPQEQAYQPQQQYAPQPEQQPYAPPQDQGYAPPQEQAYTPPQDQGYAPPQDQGYAPPSGYTPSETVPDTGYQPPAEYQPAPYVPADSQPNLYAQPQPQQTDFPTPDSQHAPYAAAAQYPQEQQPYYERPPAFDQAPADPRSQQLMDAYQQADTYQHSNPGTQQPELRLPDYGTQPQNPSPFGHPQQQPYQPQQQAYEPQPQAYDPQQQGYQPQHQSQPQQMPQQQPQQQGWTEPQAESTVRLDPNMFRGDALGDPPRHGDDPIDPTAIYTPNEPRR